MVKIIIILFIISLNSSLSAKERVYSWKTTKTHIKKNIKRSINPTTLYGGCHIREDLTIDLSSCNFSFRGLLADDGRIDIEHIVTASRMMRHVGCFKLETRYECRKRSLRFKHCHNSLSNLYPSVSTINRYRGNMEFKELENHLVFYPFGKTIGFKRSINSRFVEPREELKSIVAKAYFDMARMNCIKLTKPEQELYKSWSIIKVIN